MHLNPWYVVPNRNFSFCFAISGFTPLLAATTEYCLNTFRVRFPNKALQNNRGYDVIHSIVHTIKSIWLRHFIVLTDSNCYRRTATAFLLCVELNSCTFEMTIDKEFQQNTLYLLMRFLSLSANSIDISVRFQSVINLLIESWRLSGVTTIHNCHWKVSSQIFVDRFFF